MKKLSHGHLITLATAFALTFALALASGVAIHLTGRSKDPLMVFCVVSILANGFYLAQRGWWVTLRPTAYALATFANFGLVIFLMFAGVVVWGYR